MLEPVFLRSLCVQHTRNSVQNTRRSSLCWSSKEQSELIDSLSTSPRGPQREDYAPALRLYTPVTSNR